MDHSVLERWLMEKEKKNADSSGGTTRAGETEAQWAFLNALRQESSEAYVLQAYKELLTSSKRIMCSN